MPQENNEISWFEAFSQNMRVVFSEEDFMQYKKWVEDDLQVYREFLPDNAQILDIGCGLGCTAIPLSTLGYDVTGIDNDPDVVKAAKENARTFGGKIQIILLDILDIDKKFGRNSFDVCCSGGVLEHFPEDQIRQLIDKQLSIAPVVVASVPVATGDVRGKYKDYELRICMDGIYRNLWAAEYWVNTVLKGHEILKNVVEKAPEAIGGFDELFFVIKRKQ